MNKLETFKFQGFEVRAMKLNGQICFVLVDVCSALSLGNAVQLKASLDQEVISEEILPVISEEQSTTLINEKGLHNVMLKIPESEVGQFRKWITSEVIPSIQRVSDFMNTVRKLTPENQKKLLEIMQAFDSDPMRSREQLKNNLAHWAVEDT